MLFSVFVFVFWVENSASGREHIFGHARGGGQGAGGEKKCLRCFVYGTERLRFSCADMDGFVVLLLLYDVDGGMILVEEWTTGSSTSRRNG